MKPVALIGHVDEQHQLHVELPPDVRPGPVKITVQPATEEDEKRDWLALIDYSWAKDWSDPREDIYTLEDGKPSHEPESTSLATHGERVTECSHRQASPGTSVDRLSSE